MTTALQKLQDVFIESLGLPADTDLERLQYNGIPEWDSIAHLSLIAGIDEAFDVMLDTEDVIEMSSFTKAKEILAKYGVAI